MVSYRIILLTISLIISCSFQSIKAQDFEYKYVIYFSDKFENEDLIDEPEAFMTSEALDRRERFSIDINYQDLPVSQEYLIALEQMGFELKGSSNWLNAVLLVNDEEIEPSFFTNQVNINKATLVSISLIGGRNDVEYALLDNLLWQTQRDEEYGEAFTQINMLNGEFIHNNGYSGEGMTIAVIDAGFRNTDQIEAFDHLRLVIE